MLKIVQALNQQSAYECDYDFCSDWTAQAVDNDCARVGYFSARWGLPMRPNANLKNVIDYGTSAGARLIYNLKKIGVIFETDKPFFVDAGYDHIRLRVDAVIKSGLADIPGQQAILLFRRCSKSKYKSFRDNGPSWVVSNQAQILMAIGNIRHCIIFGLCDSTGDIFAHLQELNLNIAHAINNKTNEGVSSETIPDKLPQPDSGLNKKCEDCPFQSRCFAPTLPPPNCRNCVHVKLDGNGWAGCKAQQIELNKEMQQNLHRCPIHIYNPDFMREWAKSEDIVSSTTFDQNGNEITDVDFIVYTNILTGNQFINVAREASKPGEYSSYDIDALDGKELVGDGALEKIKTMFDAKIMDKE